MCYIGDLPPDSLFTLTEKDSYACMLISQTKFTINEHSGDDSFWSNRYKTKYQPLWSKAVVNLSWRGKIHFPMLPSAGNEASKGLGSWRDKGVFTKKKNKKKNTPNSGVVRCLSDAVVQLFVLKDQRVSVCSGCLGVGTTPTEQWRQPNTSQERKLLAQF